jgi:hypothetical protein
MILKGSRQFFLSSSIDGTTRPKTLDLPLLGEAGGRVACLQDKNLMA